ncbi:hypothetical protein [Sphingorhabdus sp. 109]|uniref:hypothetical protein n=1 Tax=Sphingorhabdus sp. 109 TaxID=2653173 RepID=UPI0012EF4C35|nr:hypothetical protein [Sphingorhabdus sp. 109]VWX62598.1 hypothetical protein SPHINGOR109_90041 [Sphingorhabdus sp. 109]
MSDNGMPKGAPFEKLSWEEFQQLKKEPNGAVVYPLVFPVETKLQAVGAEARVETTSEITIQRVKAKHMDALKLDGSLATVSIELLCALTGLDKVTAGEIDDFDAERIDEIIQSFTVPGLIIGRTV